MSFDRIPLGSCTFKGIGDVYNRGPRSTQIKEDALLSHVLINKIERRIQTGKISNTTPDEFLDNLGGKISNMILVFNQNTEYMKKEINRCPSFTTKTFEEYCRDNPWEPREKLERNYYDDESMRQFDLLTRIDEVCQLKQLSSPVLKDLAKRTTSLIKLLKATIHPKEIQFPELQPIPHKSFALFDPHVRTIRSPVKKQEIQKPSPQPVIEVTSSQIEEKSATKVLAPAQETQTSEVLLQNESTPTPTSVKVAVVTSRTIEDGTILGICCAPHWGITAFTNGENGWTGRLPVGEEWKCVILQNGQVIQWENYEGNRQCEGTTDGVLTFNANF